MKVEYLLRKCPVCGKNFYLNDAERWGYKIGTKFFCRWSCLRKYEREQLSLEKKTCSDCIWHDARYGYETCMLNERKVCLPMHRACKNFKAETTYSGKVDDGEI